MESPLNNKEPILIQKGEIFVTFMLESHIDSVVTIDTLSFSSPWSKDSFINEICNNPLSRYIVAIKEDRVIGYAGIWLVADEGHVTNVAVHPEFRGLGIGNLLLQALIDICKKEAPYGMTLEVRVSNLTAKSLYKKHGFSEAGIRKGYYADNKEDALLMWKYF